MLKKLTLIACMDAQGLIGLGGKLPWSIPEEMAHFKKYTMGKSVIMGSKTFYSLPVLLEDRFNVVVSSDTDKFDEYIERKQFEYQSSGKSLPLIAFAPSLEAFFQSDLEPMGEELICIGGGMMYESLMPYATNLVITRLDKKIAIPDELKETAVFFPPVDESNWKMVKTTQLTSSLGVNLGEIMYLESTGDYSNVVSFMTKKPLDVAEYYCAQNDIGSVFSPMSYVYEEEE